MPIASANLSQTRYTSLCYFGSLDFRRRGTPIGCVRNYFSEFNRLVKIQGFIMLYILAFGCGWVDLVVVVGILCKVST